MRQQAARVQRQGRIYRFTIAGNDYAAFIWQFGAQFRGRVEEHPQVPQCTGRTALADEWSTLADHLISEGHNFVVVDNLMGATGDTNDAATMTTVFDGLTRLTSHGIPVVVVHHESEKGPMVPGAPPMGMSSAVQKSRVWIQVRQTAKRKLRGGNAALARPPVVHISPSLDATPAP